MQANNFNKDLKAWQDIYYKISEHIYISTKEAALSNNLLNYHRPKLVLCCGEKHRVKNKHEDVAYRDIFGLSPIEVMRTVYPYIESAVGNDDGVCLFGKWAPECAIYYYLLRFFKIRYPNHKHAPRTHLATIINFVKKGCPAFEMLTTSLDLLINVEAYLIRSVNGELQH